MLFANRSLNFLLNLAIFTLFITPLNNQEATNTKNPMEQVRLEFQKIRAKNNLSASSAIEQVTITGRNCPTLYREISKIAQNFKIGTPNTIITEKFSIKYDIQRNTLMIGKQLLEILTLSELHNLIANEIGCNTSKYQNLFNQENLTTFAKSLAIAGSILAVAFLGVIFAIHLDPFLKLLPIVWLIFGATGSLCIISCMSAIMFYICSLFIDTQAEIINKNLSYCPDPEIINQALTKIKNSKFENIDENWFKEQANFMTLIKPIFIIRLRRSLQAAEFYEETIAANSEIASVAT